MKPSQDQLYMRRALSLALQAQARDEVPVGAIIVYNNRIIAQAHNQVELLADPTAHAEILAITQAAAFLKSKWLDACSLYVTIEPCAMCAGALVLSRIDKVIFGAGDPKTGAFGSRLDINKLRLNHKIKVKKGVLEDESAKIMRDFFKSKRIAAINSPVCKVGIHNRRR
jgi:tRNA(adenine34) deaminase